jgi:hypothetical protein
MYFQAGTKVLSYWFVETLRDIQSTSRGHDPVVKYRIHTITILMHQIRISIIHISSVMLKKGRKKWKSEIL